MKHPKHIAIIMDGNGRWARKKNLPRIYGHRIGVESVKRVVDAALTSKIEYLTLFAFSAENFSRPKKEVSFLLSLFANALKNDLPHIISRGIKLKFLGNIASFQPELIATLEYAESVTAKNTAMVLTIALNYSGRWHITQAVRDIVTDFGYIDKTNVANIDESLLAKKIAVDLPSDPDLLIRTGGEQRISNFMLWSLAYTELYFSQVYWPEFTEIEFKNALSCFASRQRRFGMINEEGYE